MSKHRYTEEIADVIKKRRTKVALKNGYISLFIRIIVLAIIGYLLFTQVFLVTRAKGNDMFPAVKDGDLIIAFKLHRDYQKSDVTLYREGGEIRIGRFIAQQNDVVIMDDTGTLLVNGVVQGGEILYPTYAKESIEYPYQVPENHLFILGDHRTQSRDSRDFGSIPTDELEGKVITILRRRGL